MKASSLRQAPNGAEGGFGRAGGIGGIAGIKGMAMTGVAVGVGVDVGVGVGVGVGTGVHTGAPGIAGTFHVNQPSAVQVPMSVVRTRPSVHVVRNSHTLPRNTGSLQGSPIAGVVSGQTSGRVVVVGTVVGVGITTGSGAGVGLGSQPWQQLVRQTMTFSMRSAPKP